MGPWHFIAGGTWSDDGLCIANKYVSLESAQTLVQKVVGRAAKSRGEAQRGLPVVTRAKWARGITRDNYSVTPILQDSQFQRISPSA